MIFYKCLSIAYKYVLRNRLEFLKNDLLWRLWSLESIMYGSYAAPPYCLFTIWKGFNLPDVELEFDCVGGWEEWNEVVELTGAETKCNRKG